MDRFAVDEVYGMHNYPGLPVGQFALRPGPLMAAADRIRIEVEGKGGHAAKPHQTIDTIVVCSAIVTALPGVVIPFQPGMLTRMPPWKSGTRESRCAGRAASRATSTTTGPPAPKLRDNRNCAVREDVEFGMPSSAHGA